MRHDSRSTPPIVEPILIQGDGFRVQTPVSRHLRISFFLFWILDDLYLQFMMVFIGNSRSETEGGGGSRISLRSKPS